MDFLGILGIVSSAVSAVRWVFNTVRYIISSVKNWLQNVIEPKVANWVGNKRDIINNADNSENFAKAATSKKEKYEIDKGYWEQRNLLSTRDKENLDNYNFE